MGLILAGSFLLIVYFAKIFFPSIVVEIAQLDCICKIGCFLDSNLWASLIVSSLLSFFIYYFYCCACCRKRRLNKKEVAIIVLTIVLLLAVKSLLPKQYTAINISTMVLLPLLFKGDFHATTVCFVSTNLLQSITAEIRNFGTMIIDYNYASLIVLMVDYYIFIWLLYCLFNYKKLEE